MSADASRLRVVLRTCERALRRVAEYHLAPALDQRLRELGERKEWLSATEHDELLALVAFTQQRSLEKLEAEAALQELQTACTELATSKRAGGESPPCVRVHEELASTTRL